MMLSSDDVDRRTQPVAVDLWAALRAHTQKSNFALRSRLRRATACQGAKRLQRALARVVVKLDLASPEAAHHAPAVA
jgi:hypothetical protein